MSSETVTHNPYLPCDLQQGHDWKRVQGKGVLENKIMLEVCSLFGKVRSAVEGA